MSKLIHNREPFLKEITKALGRSSLPETRPKLQLKSKPQWNVLQEKSQNELVSILKEQCKNINTDVEETTASNLKTCLHKVIRKYNGHSVVLWDDPRFKRFSIDTFDEEILTHVWNQEDSKNSRIKAERADVGITFSDITLAESATVILKSSKEKGRSVSLLPTSYIAIIPKSTIVPRLTQAASMISEQYRKDKKLPSCINFISGPSNSGDIEMNLVVGVHGPIRVTYIIVDEEHILK